MSAEAEEIARERDILQASNNCARRDLIVMQMEKDELSTRVMKERSNRFQVENERDALRDLLSRVRDVLASVEAMCERIIQGPDQGDVQLRNACARKSEECRAVLREIDEALNENL